jgi:hypothetical protein
MQNYNLDIKRTFLSFAQALFQQHPKYTWDSDLAKTKVLIVDKYVINLKVLEKKRSIVLSRGTYGWRYTSLGQRGQRVGHSLADEVMGTGVYADLLRGSVTFNCIAQNGLVAEDMAHILFSNLTGHRDQFSQHGIHQITNISIGEETLLKTDSSVELTAVPIYVRFEMAKSLSQGYDFFTIYLEDANGVRYYQGTDFYIDAAGGINFYSPPAAGTTFTAIYTDAITLNEISEPLIGTVDGTNTSFTVSYPIYTESPLFSGILGLTISGIA